MQVLIVDHEQSRLLETSSVFKAAGHQILGAGTGTECLRTARAKEPDLILLEAALQDVSGIDLAREIKRDPQLSSAYVVVLVAEGTPSSIQARALEGGADGCLARSLPSREFLARTEAMLRRRRAESALQASLQQWRDALDAMEDAVYLVDTGHKIVECNLALSKLLGKPPSEIIGRKCHELVHGEPRPIDGCLHERVRETRQREELVVPMRNRWLQVVVDPLFDAEDNLVGSVHTLSDITEQRREQEARSRSLKALEDELAETRTSLQRTTEQLRQEMDDRRQAEEALSRAHSKLEKQAEDHLSAFGRIQRALRTEAAARQELQDQLTVTEVEHTEAAVLAQQTEETLNLLRSQLESEQEQRRAAQAQAEAYQESLTKGSEALQDELSRRKQVEELLSQARVDWEEQAKTLHAHLDRTREALQEAEAAVQQQKALRMEAIRRLAGGLARQLNELLSVILGSAELGLAESEPGYPAYNELSTIQRTTRRIAEWTQRLSTIHRRELARSHLLDLNDLIARLTKLIRRLIGESIDLELILEPDLQPILGDGKALEHLLLNLAESGRLHMPEGGVLRIETGRATVAEPHSPSHPESSAGEYIRLSVVDNGAGMEAASEEQLFEPFSLAPDTEEGHGLELAEVQAIVEQHGGYIEVHSQPEQGRRFDIFLPAHKPGEETAPSASEDSVMAQSDGPLGTEPAPQASEEGGE